jgi:hypothetical protein
MWIKALLSGEYKQGRHALLEDGRYCCLGVLCELAKQDGVRVSKKPGRGSDTRVAFGGRYGYLPAAVVQWSGLPNGTGSIGADLSLADCNDTGQSFKRIADIIEKHL